jgi:hypothetical protein
LAVKEGTLDYEVLGLQEIADLLEVDKRTPHAWQYRKLLPPPDYASVNGLRAWKRDTIVKWAARTGRLPKSGALHEEALRRRWITDDTDSKPRGGRQAKAENLKALADAGLV